LVEIKTHTHILTRTNAQAIGLIRSFITSAKSHFKRKRIGKQNLKPSYMRDLNTLIRLRSDTEDLHPVNTLHSSKAVG
jgi:hypothetical protein